MRDNGPDREWNAGALLRFAFPSMCMMALMGLYTMTDTIFAARFVNTDALSAVNIVCPVVNLTVGLGTMLAAGGNAIISRMLGAGEHQAAKEAFTEIVATGAALGVLLMLCGTVWLEPLITVLGGGGLLFPYCMAYLRVLLLFVPANILQTMFANLFATAGKPGLAFGLSVLSGAANIVLDYLFIVTFGMGIRGAALGTGIGCLIPAAAGLVWFSRRGGRLFFVRFRWRRHVVTECCFNGSSEMVGQLAAAVTTYLFNRVMLEFAGVDGVTAVTILIYSQFLLNTLFVGYAIGSAPVIGFLYGNGNRFALRKVCAVSIRFILTVSLFVFLLALFGGPLAVRLFAAAESDVCRLASEGFSFFSYSFLFCGLNIFTSAMFTALSNGRVSAVLSFLRTFGLLAGGILVLPRVCGLTGVFLAVPAAEGTMFVVSIFCLLGYRKRYF